MSQQSLKKERPFVSVVIPFYDNHQEVLHIEQALRKQTYPRDRFEIILIDNGSTKSFTFPRSFINEYEILEEKNYANSPYSARNRGIEVAKGEIIAFVDANSKPREDWIEKGIACLQNSDVDLAGGNVLFDFEGKITSGKVADALTSINMEKAVRERGVAYTANLFVKKYVFEEVGLFEEGVRSGGDVRWTLKAKKNGFKIVYCKNALVYKYARSASQLYKKKIRTGKGYYHTWKDEPERRVWFYNFFRSLKPTSISKIKKINPERYETEFDSYLPGVWFHLYISGIVEQFAFMSEYLNSKRSDPA